MSYVATAFCPRPWCRVTEFSQLLHRPTYQDAEAEIPVKHVRCPRCKALSPIIRIEEVRHVETAA